MIKLKNILNEEPLNEGPSTEEKRIAMLAVRKQAKYRTVSLEQAIHCLLYTSDAADE